MLLNANFETKAFLKSNTFCRPAQQVVKILILGAGAEAGHKKSDITFIKGPHCPPGVFQVGTTDGGGSASVVLEAARDGSRVRAAAPCSSPEPCFLLHRSKCSNSKSACCSAGPGHRRPRRPQCRLLETRKIRLHHQRLSMAMRHVHPMRLRKFLIPLTTIQHHL